MKNINYVKGNVLDDLESYTEPTFLIHVCNDCGGFGSGVAGAIAKRYPHVRDEYMNWYKDGYQEDEVQAVKVPFKLGQVQFVQVEPNVYIINMIAQSTPGGEDFKIGKTKVYLRPLRLQSLEECLYRVASLSKELKHQVIGPMFGSGLAGGDWSGEIAPLVQDCLCNFDVDVTIFKFE